MTSWEFLPNPGGEEEGLGHAGIETFKGSPYPGIARECSQNSLDAAAKRPDGSSQPVHLVFRHLSLTSDEIPDLQSLKGALQACLDQARSRNLKKDTDFFERAITVASQDRIPVLAIEDYGTTGLVGPAEPGNPFYALVKSSGVSQKADADAGGSFGIGKNAAFAISSLRSVFYSTLYEGAEGKIHLAQGKSILVSHADGSARRRATGYWGRTGYEPVAGIAGVPEWLARSEVGTTVATIGFIEERNWHWQVVESLVRNFFSAVNDGSIRFTVLGSGGDPIEITNNTIGGLFVQPDVLAAAETAGTTEDLEFSAAMFEAVTSSETISQEYEFADVGTFRIRLLQRERFPKRVGILRNGMYIADNLKHFGHPLARFSLSRDFVAILEPSDKATSGRIRDMESPKHDEVSAERFDDLRERDRIRKSMKKVGQWIRDVIREATTRPAEAEILLDEMNRFFSKPGDGVTIPDATNLNSDPERIKLEPKANSPRPVGAGSEGDSGSAGGKKQSTSKGGRTTGGSPGTGRGLRGGRGGRSVAYSALRNLAPASGGGEVRIISFTPDASGPVLLELAAVGVSGDEPLTVVSVDGKLSARNPRITLEEGRRESIAVKFDQPYLGPIRMVLTPAEEVFRED